MRKFSLSKNIQSANLAKLSFVAAQNKLILTGEWSWAKLSEKVLKEVLQIKNLDLEIDGREITYLDTAGAYFLNKIVKQLTVNNNKINSIILSGEDKILFDMTQNYEMELTDTDSLHKPNFVERVGVTTLNLFRLSFKLVSFFGQLWVILGTLFKRGQSIYFKGVIETIAAVGIGGILITSLLCFLIGANLTYQMTPQFVTYGANVYIVNFLGITLLREVTPLLTAVIVAGRSGSAITASLGTMKAQEEVDALQTMGISPMRRLVMPKLIGLMIALPILTMLADVASLFGGMIVADIKLGVSYSLFVERLQNYVSINNYTIGIVKSFAFAWIIAMVGCFCGFQVKGTSDSIGAQTTKSVVMSICLIVFVDAVFAIVFASLDM